ncbi:hypothetical protein [Jeotgalicoccus psychrophilus]|uniref:hypothetical protein n=1 Tax=Jeotgalicoccus psychrophilus TaxID=157228 RepID=UPI0004237CDD|nr:hypothetical protein [Jeotgalicoccus psychrophilus]
MSDKKYSDDDVKRIVQEALRQQQEDDQRIINEAKNDKEQKDEVEIPDYLRKTPPKESVPKHWKVKEKNISEMRTGCGIMLLAPIIFVILIILLLMGGAG